MRRAADAAFQVLALLVLVVALASLATLIWDIVADGAGTLSWSFITSFSSRRASQAGIWHALTGSIFVIVVTALLAVPIGVAAAIYLEEYGGRSLAARIIELNITNLAAVPSIIYGLLGLGLFVRMMGMGRSVLAGGAHARAARPAGRHPLDARGARGPCPRRCAKARTRSARPSGRRSGTRCSPSPHPAS